MRNILIILLTLPFFSIAQEKNQKKPNKPKVDANSGATWKRDAKQEKLFKGFISGRIKDSETKKPLEFATVSIIKKRSGKLKEGTITDVKGRFLFDNIETGEYVLKISFLGFEEKEINIKTTNQNPDNRLKNIFISRNSEMLSEVTIKDEKAIYETRIDKIVYNAENDLNESETDATDVLRKAPLLSVDLEGNVSLRGSRNIKFLVNGKASTFFSSDVANALQMIPADQIKTIEVITSPGAKYEGEGDAGIVNIITKKTRIDGYKASINGMVSQKVNRTGLNLSLGKGRFGLSARGGSHGSWPGRIAESDYKRVNWDENGNKDSLIQYGEGENYYQGYRGSINAFYDANAYNTFNSSFKFGGRTMNTDNKETIEYFENDTVSYKKLNATEKTNSSLNMEWTTDYTKKFSDNDNRELVLAFQIGGDINDGYTNINESARSLENYNDEKVIEETIQIDYIHPFGSSKNNISSNSNKTATRGENSRSRGGKRGPQNGVTNTNKIEIGAKIINRDREMVYSNRNDGTYNNSEEFNYNQLVSASYISTEFSLPYGLGIKSGLRYENTQTSGDWLNADSLNFTNKSYDNYLPSFVFSKSFSPMRSIKFSYNQRIRRPSVKNINTNEDRTDKRNITIGNPNLEPTITHQLELAVNSFGKVLQGSTQLYYKNSFSLIESFLDTIQDETTFSTYKNIGESKQMGGSFFGSIKLNKLSLRGSFDIYNYSARDKSLGYDDWTQAVLLYSYFIGGNYDLGKNWKAETFGFFRSPTQTIQGYTANFSMMSFGIKKIFKNKRGSLGLRIIEPFNEFKEFETKLEGDYFRQSYVRTMPFRSIGISFKYTIGELTFKDAKNKTNINNNDLQEESSEEY
ncbi:MAG: hypothetical protein CMD16_01245 [Flavobacteriales bacterium]|nr:hypothetical protein [Flavobacteriales bacterium]|tara:strand:- start:33734 stop:36319 length:2586 start_codon:yes stop_codon:yes gene_type:complete